MRFNLKLQILKSFVNRFGGKRLILVGEMYPGYLTSFFSMYTVPATGLKR
jgi:hypothetical protein